MNIWANITTVKNIRDDRRWNQQGEDKCRNITTGVMQESYRSHTGVIQESYRSHTGVIQESYSSHTGVIHESYRSHAEVIQESYRSHTGVIQESYRSHTGVIQESYRSHTRVISSRCFLLRGPFNNHVVFSIVCSDSGFRIQSFPTK